MSVFGIEERLVAELVAPLRGATSHESAAEAFARMAWTILIEPGDQVAGQLISGLGAGGALETLIAGDLATAIDVWLADGIAAARARRIAEEAFDRWRPRLAARPVVRALELAASLGLAVLVPSDADWPVGLAALGPAEPIALWMRGDPSALRVLDRGIAVVGARAATGYGEYVATEIAAGAAERGFAIVSGGAYGIDAAAHRAALAAEGVTVAFLAGGLDRYYPAGNSDLLGRVATSGAVVAEVPPGVPPTRVRFLLRNRLLAASTATTIVIEAGLRSGSLNTANHAMSIGRPLGAVPGPITSPASAGCHRLLREDDAVCVTSVDDAIELAGGVRSDAADAYEATDPTVTRVLDALGMRKGRSVDEIARSSGMGVSAVMAVLGPLEVAEAVRRTDAGWVRAPTRRSP